MLLDFSLDYLSTQTSILFDVGIEFQPKDQMLNELSQQSGLISTY